MRLRRLFRVLLAVVLALVLLALAVQLAGARRLARAHPVPPIPRLELPSDSASLARGEHVARALANCVECHDEDFGGKVYVDGGPLGMVVGPNLTSGGGGIGPRLETEDWVRAIRHGLTREGRSLVVMPSETFVHMGEEDLAALIAYLRQVPPVERDLPPTRLRLPGKAMLLAGKLPILVAEKTPDVPLGPAVPPGATPEYGRYLADVSGCRGCHGLNLSGGGVVGPPGTPPTSNLTPAGPTASWTEQQFRTLMREGRRPDGSVISDFMPWRALGRMSNEELHAIWLYLATVPPLETGNR